MSGLHLKISVFFLLLCSSLSAQSILKDYLKYAEEKYKAGDYVYSIELYEKALELDSNTVSILWNYAESLRAFKDYRKAELYYAKVYDKENGMIYPMSLVYLGMMQQQNGHYDDAIETFKKAKKKYTKAKKEYPYIKSKQELEACLWAKSALKDTANVILEHLPETVNTKNAEFAHTLHNNQLIFSSLRADSVNSREEVYEVSYKTHLFQSKLDSTGFQQSTPIKDLFFEKLSTGNGTFSLDGNRFYFSLCQDESYNYKCKIMVARYRNGTWTAIDSLSDLINESGSNTTMPSIGEIDGQEVLFFASDREGTEGGMDIWYSVIKNGNQFSKVRNIKSINSIDNELSPWWDHEQKQLYFSSSWYNNFGGYDIFQSEYNGQFASPENIGQPFNSPANDLYYFRSGDTSYFSSNRIGVYYSKNPTCCSDVFAAHPPVLIAPPTPEETLFDLNKRLPVTLYFHNDIPDPKSRDTTTKVNYIDSYHDYRALLEKYQQEYAAGLSGEKADDAKEDIESFFIEYVDQGVEDLKLFQDLLLKELQKGAKLVITVKGFASPLAKTDYNVNLTKRRIASLINYLKAYDNGIFVPYLNGTAANGGSVRFVQVPFGEYTANKLTSDNFHDQKNSVYSRAAAIERKIEIQSVSYDEQDNLTYQTTLSPRFIDLGAIKQNAGVQKTCTFTNHTGKVLQLDKVQQENAIFQVEIPELIQPEQTVTIKLTQKQALPKGLFSLAVELFFSGFNQPIIIPVNGEGF